MIAKSLVFAVLAAHAAAGPCKPGGLSSNTLSASESASEPTTSETSVLDSVTTTTSEQATTTTEAATTTTSAAVPADEAIIFQVNPRRRLSKRDTTFVGSNNPTECTFASVFRLDEGKLLDSGVPIYYAGSGFQELAAQGEPPADSVTTTFSIAGGRLSWTDSSFGEAGFCQTESDGQVYITFGSEPVGCEPVTLTAYKEEQCQNGQIVGIETSTAETTTAAETTASSDAVQPTTSSNACVVGIDGLNGEPPRESRLADCSRLNTVTVSPYPETSTVFKREVAFRIPTAFPTWRPAMNTLAARAEGEPTATTIQPTEVPIYATYCDSPEEYYAACSEAGITAFTTTLPTTTTSTSTTVSDCPAKRLVRRAGEHMGYEFEDNWDAHIMPGYKLFYTVPFGYFRSQCTVHISCSSTTWVTMKKRNSVIRQQFVIAEYSLWSLDWTPSFHETHKAEPIMAVAKQLAQAHFQGCQGMVTMKPRCHSLAKIISAPTKLSAQ